MSWIDEMKMFRRLLSIAPSGDRIEFGVLHGATLTLMCAHPGKTYGVDSFEGMAEPTEFDLFPDGRNQYPKGRLAVSMADAAAHTPRAILIKGFVPDVLVKCPDGPFAFADVDMDHYVPTLAALNWLWDRMVPGGIIHADDHFPDRDWLASRAINEFTRLHPLSGEFERRAWWVR